MVLPPWYISDLSAFLHTYCHLLAPASTISYLVGNNALPASTFVHLKFISHKQPESSLKCTNQIRSYFCLKPLVLWCGFKIESNFLAMNQKVLHHLTPPYLSGLTCDVFSAHLSSQAIAHLRAFALVLFLGPLPSGVSMAVSLVFFRPLFGCHHPRQPS